MTMKTAIDNLMVNYGKYGLNKTDFVTLLKMGTDKGMTVQAAYTGLRCILAREYGEQELFTVEDLCCITGETPEEAQARIDEDIQARKAAGIDPSDTYIQAAEPLRFITKL